MRSTLVDLGALTRLMSAAQIRSVARFGARKISLWEGSVSAGKTIASLWALLFAIRNAPNNGLIVVIGKTLQTVYQNVFVPLQSTDLFGSIAAQVVYTNGATTARILGREVMVLGANDSKAEGKIRGATVGLAYVDEATLLPVGYWPMLITRLRVAGARLLATTNPGGRNHWLRKDYILRADRVNLQVFSFRMSDNPSLSAEYIADMETTYTGIFYDRFILGLWTNAEGAIFDMWDPLLHVKPRPDDIWIVRKLCAVDYGTTNATHAVLIGLGSDSRLYVMDEWRHDSKTGESRWTDGQLSAGLRLWLKPHPDVEWVMVDPSAASFRLQLFADGMTNVDTANNSVVDGIRTTASFLAAGDLLIDPRCAGLIEEIPGYVWDDKATELGKDEPLKENDHGCDAMRYGCMAANSLWYQQVGRQAA